MEQLFEQFQLCVEILDEVKKQIPKDEGKTDVFTLYADNVEAYATRIQNELIEELKSNIEFRRRMVTYNLGASVAGKIPPEAYHLYTTCSKYGLDENKVFNYMYNGDSEGVSAYLLKHTCYVEAYEYTNLFNALQGLALWKFAMPEFPKGGDEYKKLKYAATIAGIIELADNALRGCAKCFDEKTLAAMVAAIERYQEYLFENTVTVSQKSLPYYSGNKKLVGAIIGGVALGAIGTLGGVLVDIPVIGVAGAALGALIGFVIGKSSDDKKWTETNALRRQIEEENEHAKQEAKDRFYGKFSCSPAMVFAQNKDSLLYVFRVLGDTCRGILGAPDFSFLPSDYRYNSTALREFVKYYDNKRVGSMKEAVNLYISALDAKRRQAEQERLERERRLQQQRENEILQRKQEERARLLREVKGAVDKLYKQQRAAEEKHREDVKNLQKELEIAEMQARHAYHLAEYELIKSEIQVEKILKELD